MVKVKETVTKTAEAQSQPVTSATSTMPIDAGFEPAVQMATPARTTSRPNPPVWFWIALACVALISGMFGFIIGERVGTHGTTVNRFGSNSSTSSSQTGGFGGMINGADGDMMRRGGMGMVTATSSNSITIMDRMSGTPTTYTIDSSTKFYKIDQSAGSMRDITTGSNVMVQTSSSHSSSNSSMQKTATSISLVDMSKGPRGGDQTSDNTTQSSSSSSNTDASTT